MPRKIAINSHSSGKFKTVVINNRPHLVTEMVSIVGDSVMNALFYPMADIANSFSQLNELHAPASHPKVDGVSVSAFHPLATNAFSVGGMVRNPRIVGNQVINELVFDIEVANKDERGKAIIDKIEAGEAIGVSTGLNADVSNQSGKIGNTEYTGIVSNIKFDHVAILLNEKPAGDETFTINAGDEEVMIVNLADSVNELLDKVRKAATARFGSETCHVWEDNILFNPDRAIIDVGDKLLMIPFGYDDEENVVFTGQGVEVERKVIYETVGDTATIINEVGTMEITKLALVLAIIGNSKTTHTSADKEALLAMPEEGLVSAICNGLETPVPTVDAAQAVIEGAGMTINSADFVQADYDKFLANKEGFDAYLTDLGKAKGEMIKTILANSKMSQEQLDAMTDDAIVSLANSLTPQHNYSLQPGSVTNNDRGTGEVAIDSTPLPSH